MTAKKNIQDVRRQLEDNHHSHLIAWWDDLDPRRQQNLLEQIECLDWPQLADWIAKYVKKTPSIGIPDEILPPGFYPAKPSDAAQQAKYAQAVGLGEELLSQRKIAAFVVAGGQGTRLGFPGPKGNLPISPVKNKTLFEIFAETIAATSKKYGSAIPWYIMTSPLNHNETMKIFEKNAYFGLVPDNVMLFQQGTLPNFALDGKILLADKGSMATSPDGHGGSLRALHKSGAVEHMKERGIEFISYWQIDNALINIFDPLFIGLHALDNAQMSSKTVIKAGPFEKVGNFCLADGKMTVIEYSDLPDELAEKKNPDGSLAFQLGSIAIHMISTSFVEQLNAKGFSLPIHRAKKKIPYIDSQGSRIEPDKPNGVKLETFVFDALPLTSKTIILETIRENEFAPTKNATGTDSVETTKQMITARAADWLDAAGVEIPRKSDGSPDCTLEIAADFALCKEELAEKIDRIPTINPGDKVYLA